MGPAEEPKQSPWQFSKDFTKYTGKPPAITDTKGPTRKSAYLTKNLYLVSWIKYIHSVENALPELRQVHKPFI